MVNPYDTMESEMSDPVSTDPNCTSITEFDWDDYEEVFHPEYHDESATTVEERLKSLQASMLFISGYYATAESRNVDLDLTKFSADTIADAMNRLGYIPDVTQSDTFPRLEVPVTARSNGGNSNRKTAEVPPRVNHVETGAVGAVRNQGRCGSCWAFSTAAAVDGAVFVNEGVTMTSSVQQFVSCDDADQGCAGGNIVLAMAYVEANALGGLATDEAFPYTDSGGTATETCPITSTDSLAVSINDPRTVMTYDDAYTTLERMERLKYALATQPVTVALSALCPTLSNYRSGILTDDIGCSCEDTRCIDHAVWMVGYDDTDP
ncbi:MAG: hypothetical protein SGARI_003555, partial [Bacillariaceae sp.]